MDLKKLITWVTSAAAVIGVLWGALVTIDERYARAADVRADMQTLHEAVLDSQRSQLEREEFELQRTARGRKLSDLEAARLDTVQKQLRKLSGRLGALEKARKGGP